MRNTAVMMGFLFFSLIGCAFVSTVVVYNNIWIFIYLLFSVAIKYYIILKDPSTKKLTKEYRFFMNTSVAIIIAALISIIFYELNYFSIYEGLNLWPGLYFLSFPFIEILSNKLFPLSPILLKFYKI